MTYQGELFAAAPLDTLSFEKNVGNDGYRYIAGIDEAGRVILPVNSG